MQGLWLLPLGLSLLLLWGGCAFYAAQEPGYWGKDDSKLLLWLTVWMIVFAVLTRWLP